MCFEEKASISLRAGISQRTNMWRYRIIHDPYLCLKTVKQSIKMSLTRPDFIPQLFFKKRQAILCWDGIHEECQQLHESVIKVLIPLFSHGRQHVHCCSVKPTHCWRAYRDMGFIRLLSFRNSPWAYLLRLHRLPQRHAGDHGAETWPSGDTRLWILPSTPTTAVQRIAQPSGGGGVSMGKPCRESLLKAVPPHLLNVWQAYQITSKCKGILGTVLLIWNRLH